LSDKELRRKAKIRADVKSAFYMHLIVYVVVNIGLFLLWLFTGSRQIFGIPWFLLPLGFWAIGVVAHYLTLRIMKKEKGKKIVRKT